MAEDSAGASSGAVDKSAALDSSVQLFTAPSAGGGGLRSIYGPTKWPTIILWEPSAVRELQGVSSEPDFRYNVTTSLA